MRVGHAGESQGLGGEVDEMEDEVDPAGSSVHRDFEGILRGRRRIVFDAFFCRRRGHRLMALSAAMLTVQQEDGDTGNSLGVVVVALFFLVS